MIIFILIKNINLITKIYDQGNYHKGAEYRLIY